MEQTLKASLIIKYFEVKEGAFKAAYLSFRLIE